MSTTTARVPHVRTVYLDDPPVERNGTSPTTGGVYAVEVADEYAGVSESQIAWGPSPIDEDLLAKLDSLRGLGYQPLPAETPPPAT
jgi:hypothetical protein